MKYLVKAVFLVCVLACLPLRAVGFTCCSPQLSAVMCPINLPHPSSFSGVSDRSLHPKGSANPKEPIPVFGQRRLARSH